MNTYIVVLLGNISGILKASEEPILGSTITIATYNDQGIQVLTTGILQEILN